MFLFLCAPALALLGLAAGASSECPADSMAPTWAFVFGGVCLISFAVAVYVFCKFNEPYDLNNPKDRSYSARMGRLMCEDPIIALYICVLLFKFVWLIMGVTWSTAGCPGSFVTMYNLMEVFGVIFFACGGMYISAQLCWVTCCPEAANRSAQRVGQRQQARGQRTAAYQGAPTGVMRVPQQQRQQPIQVVQHQIPVAQAQPVYHQPQAAAPQVVIHSTHGASKQSQPTTAQRGATAARSLISGARGMFKR